MTVITKTSIIALDGHDGVGKTTLAKRLAKANFGIYVRPFEGNTGIKLIEAAEIKDYDNVLKIGTEAIADKIKQNVSDTLIFDRHWITVLSLLPNTYWECWPLPIYTFLCTANLEVVKQRIALKDEELYEDSYHKHYLNTYLQIAKQCNCTVIHTDQMSVEEAYEKIKLTVRLGK